MPPVRAPEPVRSAVARVNDARGERSGGGGGRTRVFPRGPWRRRPAVPRGGGPGCLRPPPRTTAATGAVLPAASGAPGRGQKNLLVASGGGPGGDADRNDAANAPAPNRSTWRSKQGTEHQLAVSPSPHETAFLDHRATGTPEPDRRLGAVRRPVLGRNLGLRKWDSPGYLVGSAEVRRPSERSSLLTPQRSGGRTRRSSSVSWPPHGRRPATTQPSSSDIVANAGQGPAGPFGHRAGRRSPSPR